MTKLLRLHCKYQVSMEIQECTIIALLRANEMDISLKINNMSMSYKSEEG